MSFVGKVIGSTHTLNDPLAFLNGLDPTHFLNLFSSFCVFIRKIIPMSGLEIRSPELEASMMTTKPSKDLTKYGMVVISEELGI